MAVPPDIAATAPGERLHPLRACAMLGAMAATIALALRAIAPFDHGIWLIAYLLLVGAAAPYLLAIGEERIGAAPAESSATGEAAAWLAGVAAVPAGVLLDIRLLVVVGGAALLAALASIARRSFSGGGPAPTGGRIQVMHGAVIAFMVASTVTGIALAWDTPWI